MIPVSEQRFGALLEATPNAPIIMRCDGTIDLANTHAERMFGYGRHQMLDLPVEKLIPERFRARHIALRHQFELRITSRPMGSGRTDLLGVRADGNPPILKRPESRGYAAKASFCFSVIPPMVMLGRS
jgi:PAS domain S-box-containing protein